MPTERKHREEIVRYGRMLHEHGFVAAMDGNLSVRLKHDRILVTPTCVSKSAMKASDMAIVDLDGEKATGRPSVTSVVGMHPLHQLSNDVCREKRSRAAAKSVAANLGAAMPLPGDRQKVSSRRFRRVARLVCPLRPQCPVWFKPLSCTRSISLLAADPKPYPRP